MCVVFKNGQDYLNPSQTIQINYYCMKIGKSYTVLLVLNLLFLLIIIAGLVLGVLMYRQNKKEYDDIENKKRRKLYYLIMKEKMLKNSVNERKM